MNNKNPEPKDLVPLIQATTERVEEIKGKKSQAEINNNEINYNKIKVFAIHQLLVHLIEKIEWTLFVLDKTSTNGAINILPHNAFMWTVEDWKERRRYGIFWVKTLLHLANPKWLQCRKLQVDVRELKKLILTLFIGYLKEENDDSAAKLMQSIIEYGKLEQTLILRLNGKRKILRTMENAKNEFSTLSNIILRIKQKYALACFDGLVTQHTERRYAGKFSETSELQAKLKGDIEIQKLENQIKHYNDLRRNDFYITACKNGAYYNDIQNLRTKIEIMEERYANEFTRVNSRHERLRTCIEKFHKDTLCLLDYLQMYRDALADYRSGAAGASLKKVIHSKPSLSKFRPSQISTIHLSAIRKTRSNFLLAK